MPNTTLDIQIEHILSLESDFDGEGSPAYKRETVDKAIKYIDLTKNYFLNEIGLELDEPRINPGSDGSIDLYWKNSNYELLANIPIGDEPATYYGEDFKNKKTFKGELKLDS